MSQKTRMIVSGGKYGRWYPNPDGLEIDFDPDAFLEYESTPNDWRKTDPMTFRSWGGGRRVDGIIFHGKVWNLISNILADGSK